MQQKPQNKRKPTKTEELELWNLTGPCGSLLLQSVCTVFISLNCMCQTKFKSVVPLRGQSLSRWRKLISETDFNKKSLKRFVCSYTYPNNSLGQGERLCHRPCCSPLPVYQRGFASLCLYKPHLSKKSRLFARLSCSFKNLTENIMSLQRRAACAKYNGS